MGGEQSSVLSQSWIQHTAGAGGLPHREFMECRNNTNSSPEEEISSARAGQRRLQTPCRKDWLVCRSPSRETPQKLLLLQRLVATSSVCQPGSQLERWKETLVTFISQHKAVLHCNLHLRFPRRERNKHQSFLYRSKPKLFNVRNHWVSSATQPCRRQKSDDFPPQRKNKAGAETKIRQIWFHQTGRVNNCYFILLL